MKKLIMVVAVGLSGLALLADSCAFTYQACLRDEKGEVIKEGGNVKQNHVVEIRLYDTATGGTALWGRAFSVLTDEKGLFNVAVSDEAGSPLVTGKSLDAVLKSTHPAGLFLGLKVQGSSGEIVPRQGIYAAPFAAVANDVRAVSGDLTIGGSLTFTDGSKKVTISKDGFKQEGNGGETTAQKLTVNDTATVSGTLEVGGGVFTASGTGVTVKDHPLNVQNTELQVNGSEVVPVPVGGIIMWTKADLPDNTHWAICDGRTVDGIQTPDLRGRFVVGVGQKAVDPACDYKLDDHGGSNAVQLTINEMPNHYHLYFGDDALKGNKGVVEEFTQDGYDAGSTANGHSRFYRTDARGGDKPHENRPPYWALYYIMRVK